MQQNLTEQVEVGADEGLVGPYRRRTWSGQFVQRGVAAGEHTIQFVSQSGSPTVALKFYTYSLQREQEMGLLGFSPQEMADMREAITNPMAALERQQADQLKGTMAATGAGAGDAFRVALAQADMAAERRAAVQDKIQQQNLAEKQREENMLMALSNKAAQQEAAKKAAITQAITLGIGGGVETAGKGYLLAEESAPGQDESEDAIIDMETLKLLESFFKATSGG